MAKKAFKTKVIPLRKNIDLRVHRGGLYEGFSFTSLPSGMSIHINIAGILGAKAAKKLGGQGIAAISYNFSKTETKRILKRVLNFMEK